jgi:hypothetical protein
MKNKLIFAGLSITLFSLLGCEKYLNEKPDQRLSTVETIADMQALLDNYSDLNYGDPAMGEICGDNFFLSDETLNQRSEYDRNLYIWANENVFQPASNPWASGYKQVNIANTVLQAVSDNQHGIADKAKLANIKAQALFFRAKSFLNMLGIWALPYDASTADKLPGIPLRLDPDLNKPSTRAALSTCYARVIEDFRQSIGGLPVKDVIQTRPSKAAAYGMLSRVFLQMRNYVQAGNYADSCLQLQKTLLDYNSLNANANFPVPLLNIEVVFEGRASHTLMIQSRTLVSLELYNLYAANDLRKTIFFKLSGTDYLFRGSYEGAANPFTGISTGEELLTRSECYIRTGRINEGLKDLNLLLINRYKTGSFTPFIGLGKEQALELIKQERRKELAFRALRLADIRRFNQEGERIVLKRKVNGKEYTLMPNSPNYALAIPEDIIQLTGMEQNKR